MNLQPSGPTAYTLVSRFHNAHILVFLVLGLSSMRQAHASELRFIPATPENTTLIDGSPVNAKEGAGDWKWLPGEGNQGIFESYGDPKRNAPPLVVMVDGLKARADYEVFGYFWAHGFGEQKASSKKNGEPHHWPARFGGSLASLTTYGGRFSPQIPWIISPGAKTSRLLGVSASVEETTPLGIVGPALSTASGDLRLVRALVGISRADAAGRLPVFMDDFPDSIHCGRTRIDGIAVRPAPVGSGSTPSAGAGASKALHSALRAGDHLSVELELAAGADINALDAQGIAPLFHPASVGDQQAVRFLLSKGADPNRKGQSIIVLTAASTVGDAAMVRLLVEAGAEIPSGRVESIHRIHRQIDPSHLHPAIAAIRAGSLATLKVLLEKSPELDLESLGPPPDRSSGDRPTSRYLVEDAMAMGHDELSAFLIDRGCTLQTKQFLYGSKHPHSGLLVRSITEGKALIRAREALFRRGVPLVIPAHSSQSWLEVMPWDALSAAVSVGDRALTANLLPNAKDMDSRYQELLMGLAHWSGEPEILRMLDETFPNTASPVVSEKPSETLENGTELRLLLPRVVPHRTRPSDDQHDWTLAVLPSPEVEGQAAWIEVSASSERGWKVVDRQQVKAALAEARFLNPWGQGEHRLAELGDVMAADLLVLVSQLDGSEIDLLRFEAVDVATGLPVFREHIERISFTPESAVGPLLARIRAAFTKARAGKRPKAVTMLPFTAGSDLPNSSALSRSFNAAIHAEVDATPGLLSVGKDQFQAIANEQKLGGQENLWAAAFTLEGGVAMAAGGQVALTLRLSPLSGGNQTAIDVTETGKPDQIAALASRAWKKLASSSLLGPQHSAKSSPDALQSAAEAARLLREGEWLLNAGAAAEALPLMERAGLLGANPQQLVRTHLNTLAQSIPMFDSGVSISPPGSVIMEHPPSLQYQQKICQSLDAARAMLDQASYYLALHGPASLNWTGPEFRNSKRGDFLHAVTILSYIRSSIPKVLPSGTTPDSVRTFGEDLDRFTADFFRIRAAMNKPTLSPIWGDLVNHDPGTAAMLRRNPELLKGWVTLFLLSQSSFPQLFRENGPGVSGWYGMTRLLEDTINQRLNEYKGENLSFRKAELAVVFATDHRKSVAAREHSMIIAGLGRQERSRLEPWLTEHVLARHLPAGLQDTGHGDIPHDEAVLAALLHEPKGNMDRIRYPGYSNLETLTGLENMPLSEADFYLKVNSPSDEYIRRAESLAKEPEGWAKIERLLGGALLWERIYGRPLHDGLSAMLRKTHQPDKNSQPGSIKARLLTDVRQADDFMPGVFKLPTIDISRRDRLWIYYHPFEMEPFVAKNATSPPPMPRLRQPWLMAVDCTEGKLPITVNLSQAPGLGPGEKAVSLVGACQADSGFIAQTNELIFTDVNWRGVKPDPVSVSKTGVLIHKIGGQMIPLDQPVLIGSPTDMVNGKATSSGVLSIGDEFYAMQQAGDSVRPNRSDVETPFQIVRIKPSGRVVPLTVYDRRPNLTPFDPADRAPKMIYKDENRLLVLRDWSHMGHYNPKDDKWEMDPRAGPQRVMPVRNLVDSELRTLISSLYQVQDGSKNGTLLIDSKRTAPDTLSFEGKGGARSMKVELEVPENFLRQPIYGDPVYSRGKFGSLVGYGTYETRIKGDTYHLVVLNQTDTDLILALQIGPGLQWHPGARTGLFLPLLWALPKSELFRHVGDSNAK